MEIIKGKVIHGEHLGRKQGYPTANLSDSVLEGTNIAKGVYVAEVLLKGKKYQSVLIIGVPGVNIQKEGKVEVYLLYYRGNIYGKEISITPIKKIRPLIIIKDNKELISRIKQDLEVVKNYFVSAK
ncbi:MAG: riboflavin kinase [Candidatus Kerfeldbacteria bacterium]